MKAPGRFHWRELLVLAGVPVSVFLAWAVPQLSVARLLGDRWLFEWGVGAFYAASVLVPLGWYRSQSIGRTLFAGLLSVAAWHWASEIASDGYAVLNGSSNDKFVLRSLIAGFFGAVVMGATPLARQCFPGWERRLAGVGLVGGICGGQMALLCLWNFDLGFWLGLMGWQLAVTAMLIYGTAPQRDGKPVFWPAPPQLT